jgi:probable rRNA maturation factor
MKKKSSNQNPFPKSADMPVAEKKASKATKAPVKTVKAVKAAKPTKPAKRAKAAAKPAPAPAPKAKPKAPLAPRVSLFDGSRETDVAAQLLRISFEDGRQLSIDLSGSAGSVAVVAGHSAAGQRATLMLRPEHYDSLTLQVCAEAVPAYADEVRRAAAGPANDAEVPLEAPAPRRAGGRKSKFDLDLSVQYNGEIGAAQRKALPKRKLIGEWLGAALLSDAELTVRFVGNKEGRALNQQYRHKDYSTNVLTFAYDDGPEGAVSCDLVLCCPVVEAEAREQGKPLVAHYAHLLVHGALHAQGYDHERGEADAAEMEALEIEILDQLGFPNPYV